MYTNKKWGALFMIVPIFFTLASCSSTKLSGQDIVQENVEEDRDIEPIYAMEIRDKSLWFLVQSNGCTSERSFFLDIQPSDTEQDLITLYRVRKDPCRGMPVTLALTSPLPEENFGDRSFLVKNPFITKPSERF